MRVGINVPTKDAAGIPLTAVKLQERARWIEQAGFDGIWMGDSVNATITRPDPFLWLGIAAAATEHVEVGTSIFVLPLRHPIDVAERILTLEALTPGRVSIGVGAGSGRFGHDATGIDFEDRFKVLRDNLAAVKELRDVDKGPRVSQTATGSRAVERWAPLGAGPRLIIGSWHSEIWLRRAVEEYDGWMCSAGRTNYNTMKEAIKMYRDLGGERAMVSTCSTDLRNATTATDGRRPNDDDSFNLICTPEEARDRLGRLVDLGFDDVLLVNSRRDAPRPIYETDFTLADLEEIASVRP